VVFRTNMVEVARPVGIGTAKSQQPLARALL
jgi:hypothetical protein